MLELFHRQSCPYSKRVRDYVEEKDLKSQVRYLDIDEDIQIAERLEAMTGGHQVPCLAIDGRPMLESEEIVKWLATNLVAPTAKADQKKSSRSLQPET